VVVRNRQLTDRAIYVYLPTVEMSHEWKALADKLDDDLKHYRAQFFLIDDRQFQDARSFDIVQLLRTVKTVGSDHLLKQPGTSHKETDLVKAIKQLQPLQVCGIVELTMCGWR
jgi:hypothetical protein